MTEEGKPQNQEEQSQNQNETNVNDLDIAPRRRKGSFEWTVIGVSVATLAVAGYLGLPYFGYINKVTRDDAVQTETAELDAEADRLFRELGNQTDLTTRLRGNLALTEREKVLLKREKAEAERRASADSVEAERQKRLAKGYQKETQRVQMAKLALIRSYPVDIRTKNYLYKEVEQNGMVVALLDVVRDTTSDPGELKRRYDTKEEFNQKYPGLLDREEGRNENGVDDIRLTERDGGVFGIRTKYFDGKRSTSTYKHLKLINPEDRE